MMVLIAAATANLKTLFGRSQKFLPPANRVTNHAPASASSVLPAAIPIDVAALPAVVTFTRNAPRNIAGHTRYPSKSVAPSAIPAGGHTGEALACNDASIKPSLPATK